LICFASSDAEGKVTSAVSPLPWRGWAVSVARWVAAIASTIAEAVPAAVGGAGSVKALDLDVSPGRL
jgi:hypothetical protein